MKHENTRIHVKCLELVELTREAMRALPPGHSELANQLKRASSSIALNFAEGCGRRSEKDRGRFFEIARASAGETSMIFDVGRALGAVDTQLCNRAKDLCDHISAMLYKFR